MGQRQCGDAIEFKNIWRCAELGTVLAVMYARVTFMAMRLEGALHRTQPVGWLRARSFSLSFSLDRSRARSLSFALSRRSLAFALRRLRIHVSQDHVRLQVAGKIVVVVRALISFARMLLLR